MVAVGSEKTGTAAQIATSQAASASPIPLWTVREGRGTAFALWEDALGDALPRLGLRQSNLLEQPPTRPAGESLNAESYKLWTEAIQYFQSEGTALFDAVRPSFDLDGAYASQDVRLIQM